MTTSTQSTPDVNSAPAATSQSTKQIKIESTVHSRLRRRVGAEQAMGRPETIETLASKLLTRALDDLPAIPNIPPAA